MRLRRLLVLSILLLLTNTFEQIKEKISTQIEPVISKPKGNNVNGVSDVIKSILGSTAYRKYEEIGFNDGESSILLGDLNNKWEFKREVERNPKLLEIYKRNFDSDFRDDVTILRYFNYKGNIFSMDIGQKYSMDALKIEKNYFVKIGNNKKVGKLSKSGNKYEIEEVENDEHFLQNLFPLANCKYVVNGKGYFYTVETNEYGQKTNIKAKIGGTQWSAPPTNTEVLRNKKIIVGSRDAMRNMNSDGNNVSVFSRLTDDGGHMIPRQWLGPAADVSLNIVPQDRELNQGSAWKKFEESGRAALEKGEIVELTIKFKYINKYLRPQTIYRIQNEDGKVVCDQPFENLPPKQGLWDRFRQIWED